MDSIQNRQSVGFKCRISGFIHSTDMQSAKPSSNASATIPHPLLPVMRYGFVLLPYRLELCELSQEDNQSAMPAMPRLRCSPAFAQKTTKTGRFLACKTACKNGKSEILTTFLQNQLAKGRMNTGF